MGALAKGPLPYGLSCPLVCLQASLLREAAQDTGDPQDTVATFEWLLKVRRPAHALQHERPCLMPPAARMPGCRRHGAIASCSPHGNCA